MPACRSPSVEAEAEPVTPAISTAAAEPMHAVRMLLAPGRADAAARCRLERTTLRAASCPMAHEKLPAIQQALSAEAAPSDRLAGVALAAKQFLQHAGAGPSQGLGAPVHAQAFAGGRSLAGPVAIAWLRDQHFEALGGRPS